MSSDHFRPAVEVANEDEQRALRFAVSYALKQGIATDDLDQPRADNRSLVSVARKLGVTIPDWCDAADRSALDDNHSNEENPCEK